MNKKTIAISLLVVFLTATLLPSLTINSYAKEPRRPGVFPWAKSETTIAADPQTIDEPLNPGDEKELDIKVSFRLDLKLGFNFCKYTRIGRVLLFGLLNGEFFKWLKLFKFPEATLALSVEHPDWCNATLDSSNFELPMDKNFNSATLKLKISEIPADAPALQMEEIIVNAVFWGYGNIKPSQAEINISIMAAYLPEIILATEEEQYNISPINETIIPIDVKNEGNGESKISIEFEEVPENWNVSLDREEITLDVDESDIVLLYVTPVKTFVNDTVKLKFTPMSTSEEEVDEEDLLGYPVYLEIYLSNDGSLKEEEKDELPLLEIAVIIIIVAILIIIIYFFFFWRRK